MTTQPRIARRDAADDRRRLLITAGAALAVFSLGAATQSAFIYEVPVTADQGGVLHIGFVLRSIVNLVSCSGALALALWLRLTAISAGRQVIAVVAIAVVVGAGRVALQLLAGIHRDPSARTMVVELTSGAVVVTISLLFGLMHVRSHARLRAQERSLAEQRLRASDAVAALAEEELSVRRTVAEGLHGGLQSRLVMLRVQLDHVIDNWTDPRQGTEELGVLTQVRGELDALREHEVRKLSHLLYPDGVDISLAHALTQLVRRIPRQIAVDTHIDEVSEQHDDDDRGQGERLVAWRVSLLRAAEEAISNALRHGGAARIRVVLQNTSAGVELTVDDDGSGLPEPPPRLRGLARSADRLARLGGEQLLSASPTLGGVRMTVRMPLLGPDQRGAASLPRP